MGKTRAAPAKQRPFRMKRGTLPKLLASAARKVPKRAAVIYFGNKISYQQLIEQVRRCAAGLQALGVRRGDRVALMTQNCPQFVVAYFGVLRAGAIVTPTSPIYTAREAGHQWHDAGAKAVIVDRKLAPLVSDVRAKCPELKLTVFTSEREYFRTAYPTLKRKFLTPSKRT